MNRLMGAALQWMPAVSRSAGVSALSGHAGGGRRSPVEIVATMGTYMTRTQAAEWSGLRAGSFGRWADGVTAMREDCAAFANHWQAHNEGVLGQCAAERPDAARGMNEASEAPGSGPLWVALGDSTAQGLGAPNPEAGYVGQVLEVLRQRSGLPWRVLNLSVSGALIRDVLTGQLPRLPASADLVTCGIGVNDILYTGPGKLFGDLRALLAAVPDHTVMLDLPLPAGCWGLLGRASVPYVARINRTIHRRPPPGACPWPRSPRISCPPGPGSSRPTASTRARKATATGPAPCSP